MSCTTKCQSDITLGGGNQFGILARRTAVGAYLQEMGTARAAGREGLLFDAAVGQGEQWAVPPLLAEAGLGLYPNVTFQYSSTTSYQFPYRIR